MHTFINSPLQIGSLSIPHRLIQGPLAGYSCAPFRELFHHFMAPAYSVAEMSSASNIVHKDTVQSRYIYRSPHEKILAYQISGHNEHVMAEAALKLQNFGADLIDINCGCPKTKIRKKGAGSALLEHPQKLALIINKVREAITIPLTIKIRIQDTAKDIALTRLIEDSGADALIVHGRRWTEDYDVPSDLKHIAKIKAAVSIPVIANGDIHNRESLEQAVTLSQCDAFMIGRAGTGKPWLYQELLGHSPVQVTMAQRIDLFLNHLEGLATLESEFKAMLQSKSLVRYYFRNSLSAQQLKAFYALEHLIQIKPILQNIAI